MFLPSVETTAVVGTFNELVGRFAAEIAAVIEQAEVGGEIMAEIEAGRRPALVNTVALDEPHLIATARGDYETAAAQARQFQTVAASLRQIAHTLADQGAIVGAVR